MESSRSSPRWRTCPPHGSVFWNAERMSDEQIAQRLQASALRQPQPEDFIRGDRRVGPPARRPGDGGCAVVWAWCLTWHQGGFLLLTVIGQATMWMAVFADMGASLLVVANGLRLLRR